MVIQEEIEIAAPMPVVWAVFSALERWADWNTACQSCHLIEGEEMAAGACFSFVVRPFTLPIKVKLRITECEPGEKVVWEGKRLGIHAVHTWTFREIHGRVTIISYEEFSGPLIWLARLIKVPRRMHSLTRELLASVKQEAEARYGLSDGRLSPCPNSPNCVSSFSEDESYSVVPLTYQSNIEEARKKLISVIQSMKRSEIATAEKTYIHATFTSFLFRFVDDVKFSFDQEKKIIHVRSASRTGYYDFGVNRRRLEEIRRRFMNP